MSIASTFIHGYGDASLTKQTSVKIYIKFIISEHFFTSKVPIQSKIIPTIQRRSWNLNTVADICRQISAWLYLWYYKNNHQNWRLLMRSKYVFVKCMYSFGRSQHPSSLTLLGFLWEVLKFSNGKRCSYSYLSRIMKDGYGGLQTLSKHKKIRMLDLRTLRKINLVYLLFEQRGLLRHSVDGSVGPVDLLLQCVLHVGQRFLSLTHGLQHLRQLCLLRQDC